MSLDDSHMLPDRVRNMRQLKDVLAVEKIILDEIEKNIDEMYIRASMLHEELVNEKWLEEHLHKITGGIVDVSKKKDVLFVEIVINRGRLSSRDENAVIRFLNKWLPAHLGYDIIYEKLLSAVNRHGIVWQDDEMMILRQVDI